MPEVIITQPAEDGEGTSVIIDGVEMRRSLSGVDVDLSPNHPARVRLSFVAVEVARLCMKDAQVIIPGDIEDMLVKAGWSRPEVAA